MLYRNKKRILVLDDFDSPLQDPDMVNMLKSITDSYERRILSFPSKARQLNPEIDVGMNIPTKFEFKGQLILVTNLPITAIDPALLSRSPIHEVEFNTKEMADAIQDMIKYIKPTTPIEMKQEVYDYIQQLFKLDKKIRFNFRTFSHCVDARERGGNWKNMVNVILGYKGKKLA